MDIQRILVIFAHPDDETFTACALLSMYAERGIPITYVCLTLGEMSRNLGTPPFANRETLPSVRKKEVETACEIIGISDLRLWGYRDKTLEFEDEQQLIHKIHSVILETNPSMIITFYPGFGVHPDHNACGTAVIQALKRIPKMQRPLVYGVAFAKNSEKVLGSPDVVLDVEPFIEKKIAALLAHRSQTESRLRSIVNRDMQAFPWLKEEKFWIYKWDD